MDYGEHVHVLAFTSLKSLTWVGIVNIRSSGLTDGEDIVQHSDWYTNNSCRHCKSLWWDIILLEQNFHQLFRNFSGATLFAPSSDQ